MSTTENKTLERLNELLDDRDAEIEKLQERAERAERELEGSLHGWRVAEEWPDDGELPVPRLELVFRPREADNNWSSYVVIYRLVYRHLLGQLVGVPLSSTRIDGPRDEPDQGFLPFRDGAHAAHDRAHLRLPVYKLMPGRAPLLVEVGGYTRQDAMGHAGRRT